MKARIKNAVSACCGVPIVQAAPPFTSLLCPECVNMTTAESRESFERRKAARDAAAKKAIGGE